MHPTKILRTLNLEIAKLRSFKLNVDVYIRFFHFDYEYVGKGVEKQYQIRHK